MSDFSSQIKQWVQYDNKVKTLGDELKEIRTARNELGSSIIDYATNNNIEHAVIQISDGRLKFQNTRVPQSLTLKFIKECLHEYFNDDAEVDNIVEFIKGKREVKYVNDIKRFYN